MAIKLPGTLTIARIKGRYGFFNTAKLKLKDMGGEFVVKDKELGLDQYEAGIYDGEFVVTQIKPYYYTYNNRIIVECRAHIEAMTLFDKDDINSEAIDSFSTQSQDPLEEEKLTSPSLTDEIEPFEVGDPKQKTTIVTHPAKVEQEPTIDTSVDDEVLFGILWPLGDEVVLDKTVSRDILRQQTDRLMALGYEFDFQKQVYNLMTSF